MSHTLRQNLLIYFSEVPALMIHFSGNYLLDIGGREKGHQAIYESVTIKNPQ